MWSTAQVSHVVKLVRWKEHFLCPFVQESGQMAHHWQGLFLQPAATSTMHCQPEGCTHQPPPPSSPRFSVLQAMESWTGPENKDKVNWKRFYPINASVVAMVFFSIYARISWEDDKVFMWPIFLKINEWAVVYVKEFRCYVAKIEQVKRLAVAWSRTQDTSATEPQQPDNLYMCSGRACTGGSSQRCSGFNSRWLPAFPLFSHLNSFISSMRQDALSSCVYCSLYSMGQCGSPYVCSC